MNYFWMLGNSLKYNNWMLYTDSISEGAKLRISYIKLRCSKCKKIDEQKATQIGLEDNIKIRCKNDIFLTNDGFYCISKVVQKLLKKLKVENIKFVPIPNDKNYAVLLPIKEAKVNLKKGEMEFFSKCKICGRYRETLSRPSLSSIKLPNSEFSIIQPSAPFENIRGRTYWFLLSEELVKKFKAAKFTGVEYRKAF